MGKEYSISSAPDEKQFAITVKAVGVFSKQLCALEVGATLRASFPGGYFRPQYSTTNLGLLASGTGVTPLRSICLDALYRRPERKLFLFYSIRTSDDALFVEEFEVLAKQHQNFHFVKFVTQDTRVLDAMHGRIRAEDVLRELADPLHTEFLICGSTSFVREERRCLCRAGVPEEQIQTEACF